MAITVAMRTEVSQLYVALFGRAPDADGLGYWTQRVDSGDSMTTIANAMYGTDPARAYYPLFLTNQEIVASFYLNVLGRPADAEGLAYWTAQLNAPGATPGSVITTMVNVVANYVALGGTDPAGLTSASLFNNKVAVAQYYGEHSGNIADATVVLASVTADPATVTAVEAQIASGAIGQSGITAALTTGADLVNGSAAGDTVTGVFGTAANATYNAGDVIDLGAGTTDQLNLVANGTTASDAVIVKNTEIINITDTVGATFNATLVQNNPAINFQNTQATLTSAVTGASLGSVVGLSGAGNLTVTYADVSGKTDTAMLSLNGATGGGAAGAGGTVDVSNTNGIEAVAIATAGTNTVVLNAGTGAKTLTVTGNGTNSFDLSGATALATVSTIDASASTGTNVFAMGSNFNTATVVKGGTGADTVSVTLATATLNAPTMTGVETLSTKWTDYGVLDLGSAVGLTSLSINDAGAGGTVTVQNAQSTLTKLTVSAVTTANDNLSFGYASTSKGALDFVIGSTKSSATLVDFGTVTINNSTALTVDTLGALHHDIDGLAIKGNQTAVTFDVAAAGGLSIGASTATGNVGALTVNGADGSYFSGSLAFSAGKTVGDISINQTGTDTIDRLNLGYSLTGNHLAGAGNISLTSTASFASGVIWAGTSGGGVGNISLNVTGHDNVDRIYVSAGYTSGSLGVGFAQGDVGNVTVNINGDSNTTHVRATTYAGNIGDVNITVAGDNDKLNVSGYAGQSYYYQSATTSAQHSGYYHNGGGSIGNVSVAMNGASSGDVGLRASGGHIGNITMSVDGGADLDFHAETRALEGWYQDQTATDMRGNIGDITLTIGADSQISGHVSTSGGDVGNINVTLNGSNASGALSVYARAASAGYPTPNGDYQYLHGGNIGDVNITINGSNSTWGTTLTASGGSIGNVSISANASHVSGHSYLRSQAYLSGSPGGSIGNVNVSLSDHDNWKLGMAFDVGTGTVNIQGGNYDNFSGYVSGGTGGSAPGAAVLGATSFTFGHNTTLHWYVNGFTGSTSAMTANIGDGSSDTYNFQSLTKSVGAITLTEGLGNDTHVLFGNGANYVGSVGNISYTGGAGSDVTVQVNGDIGGGSSLGKGSFGSITLTGGDASSTATVHMNNVTYGVGSVGGVNGSAWLGSMDVDLSMVGNPTFVTAGTAIGTNIHVGAAGSTVTGTEGADNIFLGAGKDTIHFDPSIDANTKTDTFFNFTAGTGKDIMALPAGVAGGLDAVLTASPTTHAMVAGEIERIAEIASPTSGQDITTKAGLVAAVNGGDFGTFTITSGADATILTAASGTAGTFYVFDINDAHGTTAGAIDAGDVTLVGVVNLTAGNIGTLVIGNFA